MHVGSVFQNNPLEALAILLCLATILYCASLVYRHRNQLDRYLVGLLGFIAAYQILRVVKDAGFAFSSLPGFDVTLNVIASCMCLGAAMILRIACASHDTTQVQLRLVEASESTGGKKMTSPQPGTDLSAAVVEASPLAMFTLDAHGLVNSWNGAAERLTGCLKKEVLGSPSPLQIEIEGTGTLQFFNRNGAEVSVAAWTAPLKTTSGNVRGRLIVLAALSDFRDVGTNTLTAISE